MKERATSYRFDDVVIDLPSARVLIGGAPVALEPKAFQVLVYLIENRERLIEKKELLDGLWSHAFVSENALTRVIAHLRKALRDDAKEAAYIETVPTRGYRFIADVAVDPPSGEEKQPNDPAMIRSERPIWKLVLAGLVLLISGIALGALLGGFLRRPAPSLSPETQYLSADLRGVIVQVRHRPVMDISPDGSHVVFVGETVRNEEGRLFLRPLNEDRVLLIAGTEGASGPIFSPDGEWVAFMQGNSLKKVALKGGPPVEILRDVPGPVTGASWGDDGMIAFTSWKSGLVEVSSDGGRLRVVSIPVPERNELELAFPDALPNGKGWLLSVRTGRGLEESRIDVLEAATGDRRKLIDGAYYGRYAPSGHLVFLWNGALLAAPFDVDRLELTGPPVTVLDGVLSDPMYGGGHLAFSDNGTFVYLPPASDLEWLLEWIGGGRDAEQILSVRRGQLSNPSLSPDGRRVALRKKGASYDVWLQDLERGALSRVTFGGHAAALVWTPDGEKVTFGYENESYSFDIYWKPADGSGDPESLMESTLNQFPKSWSPDGKVLAFELEKAGNNRDIWLFHLGEERSTEAFLEADFDEREPIFSPDGNWLAYQSNESGRYEIYAAPYPANGRKWQVSIEGGQEPLWSPDGREIIYRRGRKILSVEVTFEPEFRASKPRALLESDAHFPGWRNYDISREGDRFLTVRLKGRPTPTSINVVLNWFEVLRRRVSSERGSR